MSVHDIPVVTVRNTFVHITSTRSARRSKTQPASRAGSAQRDHGLFQHFFNNEGLGNVVLPRPLFATSAIDQVESVAVETPSSPLHLCREVTADGYVDSLPSCSSELQISDNIRAMFMDDRSVAAPSYVNPQHDVVTTPSEFASAVSVPTCHVPGMRTDSTPPSPAVLCRDVTLDGFEVLSCPTTIQRVESESFVRQSRRRPRPPRPATGPPPETLVRCCTDSGIVVFRWAVEAKKLRGSDQLAVSPPFETRVGSRMSTFRLMAAAAAVGPPGTGRGGGTFRRSKGRGTLQLKCEASGDAATSKLSFRFSIGPEALEDKFRSEVLEHDFALNGIYTGKEEWDFAQAVNEDSQVFYVSLEV